MDDLKKIMYGVTDFALMRRENAYFVDRTGLIRKKYAKGRNLARVWNLKPLEGVAEGVPGGTVGLKRILVVFHGGDVIVCEEIVNSSTKSGDDIWLNRR